MTKETGQKARNEIERHLLSCILHDPETEVLNACVSGGIVAEMFSAQNSAIYATALELYKEDAPVEVVSIANSSGISTLDLFSIEDCRDSHSLYSWFISELLKWDMRDRLTRMAAYVEENIDEPEETYCEALRMLEDRPEAAEESYTANTLAEGLIERVRAERLEGANIVTGIDELDEIVRFRKNQLITIAARPGIGKSALGGQIAYHAACTQGKKVAFFSLEMTSDELMMRGLSMLSGVGTDKIEADMMTDEQRGRVDSALKRIQASDLFVFSCPGSTVDQIIAKAKQMKAKHGLDLIVVDYAQIVRPRDLKVTKSEQIGEITRALKAEAGKLCCPVIQLAQINRDAVKADRRPTASDLKGSGSLEEDSDIILFIHPKDAKDPNVITNVDLIIEKQRNGGSGRSVTVEFVKPRSYFRKQKPERSLF